nr:hypothetical protein [Tanacetum cinerariifolium]
SSGEYVDFILAGGKASIANTNEESKLTSHVHKVILSSSETMATPNKTYAKATLLEDGAIPN